MNCMNCGSDAGSEIICPVCGQDLSVQRKAANLSNIYYNLGLDRAQIRDMSGAVSLLERSVKYNKCNINARNLLGLVYFEIGEVVSALSEWVISKNMKPEHNVASIFIEKVQANPTRLDVIHKSIKRYNRALDAVRSGEDDIGIIMLKKVLSANPKLIKAYHLLSLLYMKNGEYEKARRILKKTIKIDRTNVTTIRFLKEVDEKTGSVTDTTSIHPGMENKTGIGAFFRNLFKKQEASHGYTTIGWDEEENVVAEPVIQPIAIRQLPAYMSLVNIIIGIVIGALTVGLVLVPAVKNSANRDAEEKIAQYSGTVVTQNEHIESLENQLQETNTQMDDSNEKVAKGTQSVASYESLLNAYMMYAANDYDRAKDYISLVDRDLLSDDAAAVYDSVSANITQKQFSEYYSQGLDAFNNGNYESAASYFEKAKECKSDDFSTLAYLAHSYRLNSKSTEAIEAFKVLKEKYPDTEIATSAEQYISNLENDDYSTDIGPSQVSAEVSSQLTVASASETQSQTETEEN